MPYRPTIIPNIPSSPSPVVLRAQLHHDIIRQVNNNTIAIKPPRSINEAADINGQRLAAQYEQGQLRQNVVDGSAAQEPPFFGHIKLHELRRISSTVRVENPEDSEQYVDVARMDRVLMIGSDGTIYEMHFSNPG